jgi:hypothetical protein
MAFQRELGMARHSSISGVRLQRMIAVRWIVLGDFCALVFHLISSPGPQFHTVKCFLTEHQNFS